MQLVDPVGFGGKVQIGGPEQARHVIDLIEAGYRAARTGVTQPPISTFEKLPLDEWVAL